MNQIEQVARAIKDADDSFGYSIRLTSLVDGEAIYTLTYADGGEPLTFGSHEDASEHTVERRARLRAEVAIAALSPTLSATEAPGEDTIPASDKADILETIDNAADDWKTQGYTSALAEVRDMANVGRDMIERMVDVVKSEGSFKGWSPMDCPSEIVTDLANALDAALSPALVGECRDVLERIASAEIDVSGTALIFDRNPADLPEAALALLAKLPEARRYLK